MSRNKKIISSTYKTTHPPLSRTLSIHEVNSKILIAKFPTLKQPLEDILKYEDIKAQKQAIKFIISIVQKIMEDDISKNYLAELIIYDYIDFGLVNIKQELTGILNFISAPCLNYLKVQSNRIKLLFSEDTPARYVEYLITRYLELTNILKLELPKEEYSKMLIFTVNIFDNVRSKFHVEGETYDVSAISAMAMCLTMLSTFIPKYFSELIEQDIPYIKKLGSAVFKLTKQQLVDRDILTLCGIIYWLCVVSLIKHKNPLLFTEKNEINYLNSALSSENGLNIDNLDTITEIPLCEKVKNGIEKTPNNLCIIRGFLRVINNLDNLYNIKCIEPHSTDSHKELHSYSDFILQCCENEQVNAKIYSLITLTFILAKEAEINETTRKGLWAQQILEVILGCLDSPHKGTVKAAEDCLKSLLKIVHKRELKMSEIALPLVYKIPDSMRKRKLISLNNVIEFVEPEDLQYVKKYIKYALECILEDNSTTRMSSLCVTTILTKLKKSVANTEDWLQEWCNDFIDTLRKAGDQILVLSNSMVSIVLGIDPKALPMLILYVLQALSKSYSNELLVVLLALLIEARRMRKLNYKEKSVIVSEQVEIEISPEFIDVLFNFSDTNAVLLALSLCTANPKISALPEILDRLMLKKGSTAPSTNTYDDFREKHFKLCQKYFIDLKSKYQALLSKKEDSPESLNLKNDLKEITEETGKRLRIDAGYDTLYQPMCVLKSVWESFGDIAGKWGLHLRSNAFFAINSLSSTWELQRLNAFALLLNYPIEVLTNEEWLSFTQKALSNLCSPRSTEAEGAALFLKLVFIKLLPLKEFNLDFILTPGAASEDLKVKQLRFIKGILERVKSKRSKLSESLFKKASSEDLFHGELRFLNLAIQMLKIDQNESLNKDWKITINQIFSELQEISDYCENLLSSAGIIDEETGNIIVDCRGRLSQMNPEIKNEIKKAKDTVRKENYYPDDYENLLSTGIWLVAKESGNLYTTLSEWLVFPGYSLSSWLSIDEIKATSFNLLNKILSYKHRGAFLKVVDALQLIMQKCVRSSSSDLQQIPGLILDKVFEQIQIGGLEANKTLRRSAGIPHSILAVLRSEAYPMLLDKTLKWLLERTSPEKPAEVRVHSLNILKSIFEDSDIKSDILSSIYNALMIATDGLSDPQWKVRNSSLMVFTSCTKRIFGSCSTSEKSLNKQGKSVFEVFGYSDELCKFILKKLQENGPKNDSLSKFAIFPILLLFSRLAPSPYTRAKMHVAQFIPFFRAEIMKLLGHADIGIRQISAKALLPLIDPASYLMEATTCLSAIKMIGPTKAMQKPNLVHGLLEFSLQLLKLHFRTKPVIDEIELKKCDFIKLLHDTQFLIEWDQPIIMTTIYKILNKFINKGEKRENLEYFVKEAIRTSLNIKNKNVGYANGIKQKIRFITRFDAYFNKEKLEATLELLEKMLELKEWTNVAWIYQNIGDIYEKIKENIKLIPALKHIKELSNANLDASKYCFKVIIKQIEFCKGTEIKGLWDLLYDLKNKFKGVKQMEKYFLIFGCLLTKESFKYPTKDWLSPHTSQILNEILDKVYESQYNEEMHPIRVTAALAFTDIIDFVDPNFVINHKGDPEIVKLHIKSLRTVVQLLHSDNVEIRSYISNNLAHILKVDAELKFKTNNEESKIVIKNAGFNEHYTFNNLFDLIQKKALESGYKNWIEQYVEILWELTRNLYFLENEQKNETKNLVFIYEPLNGYINNIELKLFALKRLAKIPNINEFIIPKLKKDQTEYTKTDLNIIQDKLREIKMKPSGLVKLQFIKYIDNLIEIFVGGCLAYRSKETLENAKNIIGRLQKTGLMDKSILETLEFLLTG